MSIRQGVTVLATIKPDRVEAVRQVFCDIARDPQSNATLPFGRVRGLHFARWAILEGSIDPVQGEFVPQLMYASDFDGSRSSHFEALLDAREEGVDRVFEHCEGYPAGAQRTRASRLRFLAEHSCPFGALYQATTGTVSDIRDEERLRDRIEEFLDSRDWRGTTPSDLYQSIRQFVAADASLQWALKRRKDPGFAWHLSHWTYTIVSGAAFIALLPVSLPIFLGWLLAVRVCELREPIAEPSNDIDRVRQLTGYEDQAAQNQLTIIASVKGGWFRLATLRMVLYFLYLLIGLGIPFEQSFFGVKTIHFGRFQLVDRGRRLLFMSDYDGSWESYLGDFVDRLPYGITAVWSNAAGFPETRYLFFGGTLHEQLFKALVRDHQVPPLTWYSAYPKLTVENIKNNAAIRDGLRGELGHSELARWLQRF
jgi:hypothetical protein